MYLGNERRCGMREQIEEMVDDIDAYVENVDVKHWYRDELDEGLAEHLYNAGYRKKKEGEWKQTIEPLGAHDVDCVECSACGDSWVLDEDFDYDVVKAFWNFCPNCGAHMKGGAE